MHSIRSSSPLRLLRVSLSPALLALAACHSGPRPARPPVDGVCAVYNDANGYVYLYKSRDFTPGPSARLENGAELQVLELGEVTYEGKPSNGVAYRVKSNDTSKGGAAKPGDVVYGYTATSDSYGCDLSGVSTPKSAPSASASATP